VCPINAIKNGLQAVDSEACFDWKKEQALPEGKECHSQGAKGQGIYLKRQILSIPLMKLY